MSREELTPFEQLLYDDGYTSKKPAGVYDDRCYICNDPDFARMGLPLCRSCPACEREGRGPGHIAADDTECTVCEYDEYDEYEERAAWWLEVRGDTVKLLCGARRDGRICHKEAGHTSMQHRARDGKAWYYSDGEKEAAMKVPLVALIPYCTTCGSRITEPRREAP